MTSYSKPVGLLRLASVCAIHGLERSGGVTALVMELVEGPTLADRIAVGPKGGRMPVFVRCALDFPLVARQDDPVVRFVG